MRSLEAHTILIKRLPESERLPGLVHGRYISRRLKAGVPGARYKQSWLKQANQIIDDMLKFIDGSPGPPLYPKGNGPPVRGISAASISTFLRED